MGKKELRLGANIMCFVIGIAILTTGTPVCAENLADYTLDDVVVTATTTPVDQMKANASVMVITRQEIQANHYNTLQDALLHVPGYHGIVAANGVGYEVSGYTRPAIRGSNGVVVLIDGIEQKTDDRFYSTALTRNMDDVERIEILKGSSSVLYGSNAVGGVINIITRQRYDKPVSKLTVTGGSYHTQQYQLDTAGGDRSQFWSFSGMYRKQGDYTDGRGRRRPQDVDLKSMDLKYGMKRSDTTNLIFKYTRHNQHQTYCEGFGNNIDTDAHGILSLTSMSAILDYRAADGKSGNMLGFYRSTVHSDRREDGLPTKNLAKYPSGFYTWKEAFDARTWSITDRYYNQISPDHRLSAGFLIEDNAENIGIRSEAAYLQDEWAIGKRTVVTGGVRYSRSPQWRGTWLYGFSIGHDVNDRIHLYAASNQFLIPPTATQIYGGSPGTMRYLANLGLKPITGTSNEVGGSIRFDNTAWMDFAFFTRRQKNTIVLGYPDPHDTTLRRYYNESYNKSVHGAEFGFFKRFAKYFTGRLGYTHLDTAHDDLIQRYPHDKFTVGLSYAREKFDINLEGLGFYDIVPVTRFVEKHKKYLPEQTYWVWNLSANYRIDRNAKIFLNVNNIFDLYYMTLVDYDSVADGMRYYSKPGRNIMLGVEYSF